MTDNELDVLLPCPFCGSNEASIVSEASWAVKCHSCWSKVQCCDSRDNAIKAWNTRAKANSAPKLTEENVKNIIENEIWGEITENGIIPSRDAIKTNIISELKAAGMGFKE